MSTAVALYNEQHPERALGVFDACAVAQARGNKLCIQITCQPLSFDFTLASALDQRLDPVVDGVEEAANQTRVEVLIEPEIEQHIERVATSFTRNLGDGAVGEPGIHCLHRRGDDHALPVALEHRARFGVAQVGAERVSEARVAEHRFQLPAVIGLDRVERRMAVERIARLGQPDGISPSRMAEMLEVAKAGPKVRC